jgi:hypothetical protein
MTYYRDADYDLGERRMEKWVEEMESQYKIPEQTMWSLARYVVLAAPPGGFVTAVLQNDFHGAISRADEENRAAIVEIMECVWNLLPGNCHGDAKAVARWAGEEVGDV